MISSLLTIPPLDKLINLAPFLNFLSDSLFIKSFVSSTKGT